MIELFDEKLGVIKVLNVTDVRAHFAAVLSDDDCNYIITKNNRPQRVMISYTDFERLKNYVQNDESVPAKDPEQSLEKVSKTPIRKEPIRGMLASQIELAQTQPEKKTKKAILRKPIEQPIFQKAVVNAPFMARPEPPAIAPEKSKAPRAPLPRYDAEDDYFKSSASIEDETPIAILPKPEIPAPVMTHEEEAEYRKSNEIAFAEAYEQQNNDAVWNRQDELVIKSDDEKPRGSVNKKPTIEGTQDPEKEAYFSKYKKLYESYYETSDRLQAEPDCLPAPIEKKESAMPSVAPKPQVVTQAPLYRDVPAAMKKVIQAPSGTLEEKKSTALPSLQELLKELELEKLSGDDEPMKESDIDELILRITHD
jgi:prevent-host-death family protein